ncbi:MAG: twin-arginine translocase TatA/TatE family subunit [Chloroflexota bacterium]
MGIDSIFGIGGPEFFLILIIAGIVLGPRRIAQVASWLGKTTAYLQSISRGFANQLRQELEDIDGETGDLKDMLAEMNTLRQEVNTLQNQLKGQVNEAVSESNEALKSIKPPTLEEKPKSIGQNGNGSEPNATEPESVAPPQLPNLVDVEDDPE